MKRSLPKLLLLLFAASAAGPLAAQDEAGDQAFYRVEAVVFTHVGGDADEWPVHELADHSDALDPAWQSFARQQKRERAEQEELPGDPDLQAALNMVEIIASLESGEQTLTEALLYPEPWLALDELSQPMARALSRLEQSGAYRVHSWLAWHQPLDARGRSRTVRVHGDTVVGVGWITLSPTGRLLRDGRVVASGEDLMPDFHYRLDGTIRLRQRQFMHADVTLDWRVPETIGPSPWPLRSPGASLEGHRLDQSRTIRPGRFEYFDSAWLGLLLRVTPFEPDVEAPPGEAGTP